MCVFCFHVLLSPIAVDEDVREEVIEEGFQEHFQSLTNMITSSALIQQSQNGDNDNKVSLSQTTPKKVQPTLKFVPASPNLDWLNGEVIVLL